MRHMDLADRIRHHLRLAISRRAARRDHAFRLQEPIVSFTFDDFPKNAVVIGGKILNERGIAATFYASFGLMGKTAPTGRIFDRDDLAILLSEGHELGCHTYAHCHAWNTPTDAFESSVRENAQALQTICPGAQFSSLSYPVSCPSPAIKRLCAKYFRACRGGGQTYNAGTVDLGYMSAFFLEQSRGDVDAVKKIIEANCQARGWLIFATHDINGTPTRFGCTPDFLSLVAEFAARSGALVVPVSAALNLIGANLAAGQRKAFPSP